MRRQLRLIEEATHFLAGRYADFDAPLNGCAGISPQAVCLRTAGNGLRELDLFLSHLILQAMRIDAPLRARRLERGYRPFSAAKVYRQAGRGSGGPDDHYGALKAARALQNRFAFAPANSLDIDTPALRATVLTLCALYREAAHMIGREAMKPA